MFLIDTFGAYFIMSFGVPFGTPTANIFIMIAILSLIVFIGTLIFIGRHGFGRALHNWNEQRKITQQQDRERKSRLDEEYETAKARGAGAAAGARWEQQRYEETKRRDQARFQEARQWEQTRQREFSRIRKSGEKLQVFPRKKRKKK
jgi:hypothetical protein